MGREREETKQNKAFIRLRPSLDWPFPLAERAESCLYSDKIVIYGRSFCTQFGVIKRNDKIDWPLSTLVPFSINLRSGAIFCSLPFRFEQIITPRQIFFFQPFRCFQMSGRV